MKTWIDWASRIAGGMLFHGGYVATPAALAALPHGTGEARARQPPEPSSPACGSRAEAERGYSSGLASL